VQGYRVLDPTRPSLGKHLARWGLIDNLGALEGGVPP
jgi:predicted transcriptional regulator of viral defense system